MSTSMHQCVLKMYGFARCASVLVMHWWCACMSSLAPPPPLPFPLSQPLLPFSPPLHLRQSSVGDVPALLYAELLQIPIFTPPPPCPPFSSPAPFRLSTPAALPPPSHTCASPASVMSLQCCRLSSRQIPLDIPPSPPLPPPSPFLNLCSLLPYPPSLLLPPHPPSHLCQSCISDVPAVL
jgi:hypothetical protein